MSKPTTSDFHESVHNEDIQEIGRMLAIDAELVNAPHGRKKTTPLHVAVEEEMTEVVKVLLEKGARYDIPNYKGITPLHLAAREGLKYILQIFVDNSNINLDKRNHQGRTALHLAIKECRYDCADILIKAGAGVNEQDKWNKTPLHIAAERNSFLVVERLLNADANPTVIARKCSRRHPSNKTGKTPLHYAIAFRRDANCPTTIPGMMIDKLSYAEHQ